MPTHVLDIDIAVGLKELLVKRGYTIQMILESSPSELAQSLGIEQYVGKIIRDAAARQTTLDDDMLVVP